MKALIVLFALVFSIPAFANELKIIVNGAVGSPSDLVARRLQELLHEEKIESIINNEVGAVGNISIRKYIECFENKTRCLSVQMDSLIANKKYATEGYPENTLDLAKPLYLVGRIPAFLSTSLNVTSMEELITISETRQITIPVVTRGNWYMMYMEICKLMKNGCLPISYRSASQAMPDFINKQIDLYIANDILLNQALALAEKNNTKVTPLATLWNERLLTRPNLKTMDELGFKGINKPIWVGIFHANLSDAEALKIRKILAEKITDEDMNRFNLARSKETLENLFAKEVKQILDQ